MNEPVPFSVAPIATKGTDHLDQSSWRPPQRLSTFMIEDDEPEFDPWKYWFVVRKHLRLIIVAFLAAIALTLLIVLSSTPLYTSTTVVMVERRVPHVLAKEGASDASELSYDENYYKTQEAILESRSLAAQVIKDLALNRDKAFLGQQIKPPPLANLVTLAGRFTGIGSFSQLVRTASAATTTLFSVPDKPPIKPAEAERPESGTTTNLINRYLAMMKISPEAGTSLIRIAFITPDPRLSERLADAHAHAYAQIGIKLHDEADQEIEHFLQSRLVGLRAQLEKSELELNSYRRAHDIIPGLMSLDGKQAVVLDRIRDLSKELTSAEVERIGLEAQVQAIKNGHANALSGVTSSPIIQDLQNTLNGQYAEIAGLSNQFKPGYPPLAQLEAKAEKTREGLRLQIKRIVDSTTSSYEVALGKERRLRAEMDSQKQEALNLNDAAVKYAMLQREVDANRELTDSVLQKIKDLGLEAESEASNVSVVDPAEVNLIPTSPRKKMDLLAGGAVGLLTGLLVAFSLEYLSNTLNSPDEVERFLQLPNLGVVPEFSDAERQTGNLEFAGRPLLSAQPSLANKQLVSSFSAYSMVADAYRSIRTGLLLSRAGSPPKVTLITSAAKGEGKTLTAINTAMMLAHVGARVLLVDSDLRRGSCHTVLGMPPSAGLTELLIGAGEAEQLIQGSNFPNLSILMRGTTPPNSTELVGSDRMRQLLADFAAKYDFVVVDSPPLMPVSDAMLLSTMVDGVILVVDSSRTPKKQIRAARTRLEYAGAKIFGFVVNRMHPKSFHYHYYYGNYYGDDAQTG